MKRTTSIIPWSLCAAMLLAAAGPALPVRADEPAANATVQIRYPALPQAITSFGAAVSDGWLYVYGGNTGGTHTYSNELQSNHLRRLNLKEPGAWEELPGDIKLQGLAMVSHGGKLYRIGGFTARNMNGEAKDLWSVADVARFDPATQAWEKMPSLPAPRSSHDAVVLGDTIYVAGGWAMAGKDGETKWHNTALALDLSQANPTWVELPEAPFRRRALSLATLNGKVYAIGGMLEEGGTTTEVDVYDPATRTWATCPDLPGKSMEGFGNSAFELSGRLFVSTVEGNVQQFDGENWSLVTKLQHPRFFHRMLPVSANELVFVGGSGRSGKRTLDLEVMTLAGK